MGHFRGFAMDREELESSIRGRRLEAGDEMPASTALRTKSP
jgi:hypothetical protein